MGSTEDFSVPPVARAGLLERDRELAALEAVISGAATGAGGVAAVTGPAGIGKTSLLRAAAAMAERHGMGLSFARGSELEASFSYGIVKQLFEPLTGELDEPGLEAAFAGAAAAASAVVLGGALAAAEPSSRDRAFAVVHGLYWLCANLALKRPLILVVDDLHWADAASLRFLAYLTPRVAELPVAVITASRPVSADGPRDDRTAAPRRDLVEAVTSRESVVGLAPGPLSVAGVGRLVQDLSGDRPAPAFAQACHTATGGNPFLCSALVTALSDEGVATGPEDAVPALSMATRAVATVVVRRLGRLSPASTALAGAVAVLGSRVELRHAAALADLGLQEAAAAADALASQGIFRDGPPLEFTHPLVRACVHDRLPAARRSLLHAQAARLLRDQRGQGTRVAAHLLLAEPTGEVWAVEALETAADRASADGDPAAAVSYLRRALDEPPPTTIGAELLHRLGAAELQAGDVDGAAGHLRDAYSTAADAPSAASAGHDLALALTTRGDYPEAVAVLEACAEQLAGIDPDRVIGLEAELHQSGLMDPTQYAAVSRRVTRLPADPAGATPGERALLAALATEACLKTQPADTVRRLAARAFERGLLTDHVDYASLWGNAVFPLIFAEGYNAADGPVEHAIAAASRRGSPVGLARAYGTRALLQLRRGSVRDAEADARASVDLGLPAGYLVSLIPLGVLVEALVERDETTAAEAALNDAGRSGVLGPGFLENWVLHSRGWLRLAQDRAGDAAADFEELGRRGKEGWRPWNPGMFAYRSGWALALWRLGDEAAAQAVAAEEVEWARRWGGGRALGIALRTAGQVDHRGDRLETLRASVTALEGSGARQEHARSLVTLGAALRRQGKRTDASRALHEGMDLSHRCGGLAVARFAREELVTLGERPRRAASHGVDALTASERRVARLAAVGVPNRAIAQTLFVTVRTVEVHLTSAYRKLGISARDQLPAALGDDH